MKTEPSPNEMGPESKDPRPDIIIFCRNWWESKWPEKSTKDSLAGHAKRDVLNLCDYLENERIKSNHFETQLAQMKEPCKWKQISHHHPTIKGFTSFTYKASCGDMTRSYKQKMCENCGHPVQVEIDETKGGGAEKEGKG